jgi:hypothetical protein
MKDYRDWGSVNFLFQSGSPPEVTIAPTPAEFIAAQTCAIGTRARLLCRMRLAADSSLRQSRAASMSPFCQTEAQAIQDFALKVLGTEK